MNKNTWINKYMNHSQKERIWQCWQKNTAFSWLGITVVDCFPADAGLLWFPWHLQMCFVHPKTIQAQNISLWIRSLTRVFRFFEGTPCATKKISFKNGKPSVQAPGTVLKESYPIAPLDRGQKMSKELEHPGLSCWHSPVWNFKQGHFRVPKWQKNTSKT